MPTALDMWTGNGLADGTTISSSNVNTAGNGAAMSVGQSAVGGVVTAGDGVDIAVAANVTKRLDSDLGAGFPAVVSQMVYTPREHPTTNDNHVILSERDTGQSRTATLRHQRDGRLAVGNSVSAQLAWSPAVVLGHRYLINRLAVLAVTPSTTTGRIATEVWDLDDPTWNAGAGEWYHDSEQAANLGTNLMRYVQFCKVTGDNAISTASRFEMLGRKGLNVDLSGLDSRRDLRQFFGAAPYALPTAPPPTVVPGTILWIGDSTSNQDGFGEARIRARLRQIGFPDAKVYFYARDGRGIMNPDSSGNTTLQVVNAARAQLGGEAEIVVFQIGSNGHETSAITNRDWMYSLLSRVNPASRVFWMGISQVDGYVDGAKSAATRQAWNAAVRPFVESYPNARWGDWNKHVKRLGDSGLWSADGVHHTVAGYTAKNRWYIDTIKPGPARGRALAFA